MIKQKTYILVIATAVYLGSTFFGALFMYKTIYDAGELLTTRVNTIASNDVKEKMIKDLELSLVKTEEERTAVRSFVLTEDKTSLFLTDIEQVARAQSVVVTTNTLEVVKPIKKVVSGTSTSPAPVAEASFFDTLIISFSLEGDEKNVQKMLKTFETLPYHSSVTSFSLKREGGGKAKATLGLTVSLLK